VLGNSFKNKNNISSTETIEERDSYFELSSSLISTPSSTSFN